LEINNLPQWVEGGTAKILSERDGAERLIQRGHEVGTIHNEGRILRFGNGETHQVWSLSEPLIGWKAKDGSVFVWDLTRMGLA
jgi:hypothetical protein